MPRLTDVMLQRIVTTILIILIALIIGFWYGATRRSGSVQDVVRSLTDTWDVYTSEKHGFRFRHPSDWTVVYNTSTDEYRIIDTDAPLAAIRVQNTRSISKEEPLYAIQVSIPFDKRNFIVFSTSTDNAEKTIFYTAVATLTIGNE